MYKEWLLLIKRHEEAGARSKFETICTNLFKRIYFSENVRDVEVKQGDGGIDMFIGKVGIEKVAVIQCKFFVNGIGKSQRDQIRKSFNTAIRSKKFEMKSWTLCVINKLTLDEHIWWSVWSERAKTENGLEDTFISMKDGSDLINLLKDKDLYAETFELENSGKNSGTFNLPVAIPALEDVKTLLRKASSYITRSKNFLGNDPGSHIRRGEVQTILDWVDSKLPANKKNILVVKGDKGNGKTVVLRSVYEQLLERGGMCLCVKADKYYATTCEALQNKLFTNNSINFSSLLNIARDNQQPLIIIIDQLDALSQTLSSNREYLYTYSRIISDFEEEDNARIIISVRSYDLEYDAELRNYNGNEYEKVNVGQIEALSVKAILQQLKIKNPPESLIELLRTPYHLEIYLKLFNLKGPALKNFNTGKELFDELWKELVLIAPTLQIKELLYKIASDMYQNEQRILIQNRYFDEYSQELALLKSNQIIIEDQNEIQFWHQTMYDYCFAKSLIDNDKEVESYILENGQSIYIRSVAKMMIEFLRDDRPKIYLRSIETILKSPTSRFHIKTLLISILGFVQKPSEKEQDFAKEHLLYDDELASVFLNSIHSEGWLNWVIDQSYFEGNPNEKKPMLWTFFLNNINFNPNRIVSYIEKISDFDDKNLFIGNLLTFNRNWDSIETAYFFDNYVPYDHNRQHRNIWYFDTLKRIAEKHPKFAFRKLDHILSVVYSKESITEPIDSDLLELIGVLEKADQVITFEIIYKHYISNVEENKAMHNYEDLPSPYFEMIDGIASLLASENVDSLETILFKIIRAFAIDRSKFLHFYTEHKNSNCLNYLRLLAEVLMQQPEIYAEQIFDLIRTIDSKNGFQMSDNHLQHTIRQTISCSFQFFSYQMKIEIIKIIENVSSPYETPFISQYSENSAKTVRNYLGQKKYLFLLSVGKSELKKFKDTYRTFTELLRKYENTADSRPIGSSYGGFITIVPPLPETAYKKMTTADWEKSMLKFNANYHGEFLSPQGGIREHSREFYNAVKDSPHVYVSFLHTLIENIEIDRSYVLSGFEGLVDTEYDLEVIKEFFQKLIKSKEYEHHNYTLISCAKKIISKHEVDDYIFNFLVEIIERNSNTEEQCDDDENIVTDEANAIEVIISCHKNKRYSERIFSCVERVLIKNKMSIKISLIRHITLLNSLDLTRAFKIFQKLVEQGEIIVLKNSFFSAQNYNRIFHHEMYPYFEHLIRHEDLHEKCSLIVLSWFNDEINDKSLYDKFVAQSVKAKHCALSVAECKLRDNQGILRKKAVDIFCEFLSESCDDEDHTLANSYAAAILRKFKDEKHFLPSFDFFTSYASSEMCRQSPNYFLDYLTICANKYPVECLLLLKRIDLSRSPNARLAGYYKDEPIQLLLAIYSTLSKKRDLYSLELEDALTLFDDFMRIDHLRSTSSEALEKILH